MENENESPYEAVVVVEPNEDIDVGTKGLTRAQREHANPPELAAQMHPLRPHRHIAFQDGTIFIRVSRVSQCTCVLTMFVFFVVFFLNAP